jgi:hypothetical protein
LILFDENKLTAINNNKNINLNKVSLNRPQIWVKKQYLVLPLMYYPSILTILTKVNKKYFSNIFCFFFFSRTTVNNNKATMTLTSFVLIYDYSYYLLCLSLFFPSRKRIIRLVCATNQHMIYSNRYFINKNLCWNYVKENLFIIFFWNKNLNGIILLFIKKCSLVVCDIYLVQVPDNSSLIF